MSARVRLSIIVAAGAIGAAGTLAGCDGLGCRPSDRHRLGQLATELPAQMCADGSYYRNCFDMDRETCIEAMHDVRAMCTSRGPGGRVEVNGEPLTRERLARCMGNAYESGMVMMGGPFEGCTPETLRSGAWKRRPPRSGESGLFRRGPGEPSIEADLVLGVLVHGPPEPVACEPVHAAEYDGPEGESWVVNDIARVLADRDIISFLAHGFGGHWDADVRTDLATLLEQLPDARLSAEEGAEFAIVWYEHGLERTLQFEPDGDDYVVKCISFTEAEPGGWTPEPREIRKPGSLVRNNLRGVGERFDAVARVVCPALTQHPAYLRWRQGALHLDE